MYVCDLAVEGVLNTTLKKKLREKDYAISN